MSDSFAALVIVIAILLLILYAWHSHSQPHPIVNTKLFYFRTFRISVLGNLFARTSFGGLPFLLPLLLQFVFGYSSEISGLLLAPTALGVIIIKPFSVRILQILGFKRLLITNTICIGLLLCLLMLIDVRTPVYFVGLFTFAYGFFLALQYSGMNSLAYADIPTENFGSSTSLMSTVQQVSQSFGVALAAFLLYFFSTSTSSHTYLNASVFHRTFLVMGVFTLLSSYIFVRLRSSDGQQMIQKKEG